MPHNRSTSPPAAPSSSCENQIASSDALSSSRWRFSANWIAVQGVTLRRVDDARDGGAAGALRRDAAPMAGDDLVPSVRLHDGNRIDETNGADAVRELGELSSSMPDRDGSGGASTSAIGTSRNSRTGPARLTAGPQRKQRPGIGCAWRAGRTPSAGAARCCALRSAPHDPLAGHSTPAPRASGFGIVTCVEFPFRTSFRPARACLTTPTPCVAVRTVRTVSTDRTEIDRSTRGRKRRGSDALISLSGMRVKYVPMSTRRVEIADRCVKPWNSYDPALIIGPNDTRMKS
jgi:hypothetical protein